MKKLLAVMMMMLMVGGTAFAGGVNPFGAFNRCMNNVEKACKAEGLTHPFAGGDTALWNACTASKYNQCWCNHKGKPLPNQSC